MKKTTYFEHYRVALDATDSPIELGRVGPAIVYKASDLQTGAPVALTLLPLASVASASRDRFLEQAKAAQQLDHINIAKIFEFGQIDDEFAFVSEYPLGDTVEAWIAEHGPMPPEAVLRIALQVMSALSAARLQNLHHPAIQPSNLLIVPGRIIEGGWPFVKLANFGLAGLEVAPERFDTVVGDFASPEQLCDEPVDFRSEIYSLGATMCFLLTGAFYSAEPRSSQTRRFAGPLRKLIAPTLQDDPNERPQDPNLFTQSVRSCLGQVERRQALQQKFGIPFVPIKVKKPTYRSSLPVSLVSPEVIGGTRPISAAVPPPIPVDRPTEPRSRPWFAQKAVIVAAVILTLTVAAAAFLPAPVNMLLHSNRDSSIGVPVGVAESSTSARTKPETSALPSASPPPVAKTTPKSSPRTAIEQVVATNQHSPSAPTQTSAQPSPASPPPAALAKNESSGSTRANSNSPAPISNAEPEPSASPSAMVAAAEAATRPAPPGEGPQSIWERIAGESGRTKLASVDSSNNAAESNQGPHESTASKQTVDANENEQYSDTDRTESTPKPEKKQTKPKTVVSRRADDDTARSPFYQPFSYDNRDNHRDNRREAAPGTRTVRARYVGMTPDGNLILLLPSGETAIVNPRAARLTREPPHRVRRQYYPPRAQPVYPDD